MMKIVFIGPFGLQPKSTMRVRALFLAKSLAGRGHQVAMVLPPWDDPARSGQSWEEDGITIINVALPPGIPLLFHLLLTWRLVRQALAWRPEVIHFFKPKAYAGLAHLALWWLRRLSGRSIRLVVDSDDWEQAWNNLLPYSPLHKKLFAWQESWGLRHADAVTVASRALEALAGGRRVEQPPAICYLPNGYWPAPNGASLTAGAVREQWQLGQAPTILLYSRLLEFRLERVVTLVRYVAERLPEARWLVVGQGLQGEERWLANQLTQAGLAEFVRFTGWLPYDQTPAYFQAADVAIFPYDDTVLNRTKCSVRLIDLLAAGLPVVADAVGQNKEYIEHDFSGVLTPAEDDTAFGAALVALLQDPERQERLGQAAAQRMRRQFNWPELSQLAERVYR
jgi:glycosyltransferase involved in cell wall biosynthesis